MTSSETAAKENLVTLLKDTLPSLDTKHITFSPYRDLNAPEGQEDRTTIYLALRQENPDAKTLKAISGALQASNHDDARVAGGNTPPLYKAKDEGSGVSITFKGTMRDLADIDADTFKAHLADRTHRGYVIGHA